LQPPGDVGEEGKKKGLVRGRKSRKIYSKKQRMRVTYIDHTFIYKREALRNEKKQGGRGRVRGGEEKGEKTRIEVSFLLHLSNRARGRREKGEKKRDQKRNEKQYVFCTYPLGDC